MTSSGPPPTDYELPSDDEQRLFALLDRYVDLLHDADIPSRSLLLARHPELGRLLACLESLDSLAPPDAIERVQPPTQETDNEDETETVRAEPSRKPSAGAAPSKPQIFGKFELLGELGRGGMGVVYRARQTDLDRVVALKMILSNHLAGEEEVQRFYAEARAAGRLRHPNIVGIHEVGEVHGQHYFAMDCVEGPSLADRLRTGPADPRETARILSSVARAVHYLHEHGIIHRDLKPSNILLDSEGNPCVTDFGLAKVFQGADAQTASYMIVGTPGYMSPEQAAGRSEDLSPKSDIYSLGAILYLALTGQAPYGHSHPLYALIGALDGDPPLPRSLNPDASRDLQAICLRCLEKDPADRYSTAAALADDLERYLSREPVEARSTGIWQRLRRWARRETALASRWVALVAAAGIVQVKYLYSGDGLPFHLKVMGIFGVWAVIAFFFQKCLHRESLAYFTRFAWAAADVLMLTWMFSITGGPVGPLLVGYPLLIAASGLFFRVRLVWFTTVVSILSYAALVFARVESSDPPHYPVIFAAALGVIGFIMAYQVERVRILTRYYEQRRRS